MALSGGKKLGPYEIIAPLGAGGMGEVYRAKDTRLDREVAIKVLPERLANDADALARFEREAKAVAALSHPNILAIHDVGHEHGISFVVTELLEGETLRERLHRSAIPWRKAVEHGVAVADGLAAAHAKGIIHRDLKPENIFITTAGHVKILDFGLARMEPEGRVAPGHAAESTPTITLATRPGAILGTLNYMSPEQVRGLRTDGRSDIFSLGCVIYEMVAGRRAFTGDTPADTMTAILKEEPPAITDARTGIRPELERVIVRCLEKKPEQRFQSAPDLAFTLRSLLADTSPVVPPRRALLWYAKAGIVGLVAAALLVGAFMVRRELRLVPDVGLPSPMPVNPSESTGLRIRLPPDVASIAVLPFTDLSAEKNQEYFSDGLAEELLNTLVKVRGLRVAARTSSFQFKGKTVDIGTIGQKLNVGAILEGSVRKAGQRVRITAQLINVADGFHLWSETFDRELEDIFVVQEDIARSVSNALKVTLLGQEDRTPTAKNVNAEAYNAYLLGQHFRKRLTVEDTQKAITYFEQALESDPGFAPAWVGVGETYRWQADNGYAPVHDAYLKAREAVEHALELDSNLAIAHWALGLIKMGYDWDWSGADADFQKALGLEPGNAEVLKSRASLARTLGRIEESEALYRRVLALDPLDVGAHSSLAYTLASRGRADEAVAAYQKNLELNPNLPGVHASLGMFYLIQGRFESALLEIEQETQPQSRLHWLALAYHALGRTSEADAASEEYIQKYRDTAAVQIAETYAYRGETDPAFEWLERAYTQRDHGLTFLKFDPFLKNLQSDPRYGALLQKMRLPPLPAPRESDPPLSPLSKGGGGKIMLAVLPFENLSRDPEQDYFSDGLTEEMISQLSRLNPKKLGVIARTSAMHYKNTAKTIDAIGRELGVAYIVEGSVRRADNQVRITAKLIKVEDQAQLWTDSFVREFKDILTLQSDVAERIAGSLTVELLPGAVSASARARTINPAAHEAYMKGRFYWNKRTPESLHKAVEYFEQAVLLDPAWPLAYAGLADAYVVMPHWGCMRPSEAIPKAKAAAVKASEMDESLAEAHASLGYIATTFDWNWPIAEREYDRAITLSPNYATAHQWYALHLVWTGRHGDAIREITKAQELDPLSLIIGVYVGVVHYYAGDFAQAETRIRKTLELGPDFAPAHGILAKTLFLQGRFAEAITEAREVVRLSNNKPSALLGYVCAKAGQAEEARWILDEFAARSTEEYVAPTNFARVHAGLDERDRMFEWLEKAYQERDINLLFTLTDPLLAPMRTDPRFADLLRRVGLPAMEK